MKGIKYLFLIFFFLIFSRAEAVNALVDYAVFYLPEEKQGYVEIYLAAQSSSVSYPKTSEGKYQGGVRVSILIKKDTSIHEQDTYVLKGPALADTTGKLTFELLDEKRYKLGSGMYMLEVRIEDLFDTTNFGIIQEPLIVDFQEKEIFLSDIELLHSFKEAEGKTTAFVKNGYYMMPSISGIYPPSSEYLPFYAEIYNAQKFLGNKEPYVVFYAITAPGTEDVISGLGKYVKQTAQPVNVILAQLPIADLPTGTYELVMEVRNKENKTLAKKSTNFQRVKQSAVENYNNIELIDVAGTFADTIAADEIEYYLASLHPIADNDEIKLIKGLLKEGDTLAMRQFFLNFWMKRDVINPDDAWLTHKERVDEAEKAFSTRIRHGFETDRGRIYVKYGAPNNIVTATREPHAYPYEVWTYHAPDETQRNVKYIFYDPEMSTNDYRLIHSTARGEIYNPKWKEVVMRENNFDIRDDERNLDGFGNNIDRNFDE